MKRALEALSLFVNRHTGGEPGQYLCARMAEKYGAYSWPCRVLDVICWERGHCRKQAFRWKYREPSSP